MVCWLDIVSLFSGVGGMDHGFIRAGHKIVWANDKSVDACKSYEKNLQIKPVCKDIRKVCRFPPGEIVVACNPCQGFSVIGNRDPEDPRNYLYKEIVRCLLQVKPKFFVTENVKGLKTRALVNQESACGSGLVRRPKRKRRPCLYKLSKDGRRRMAAPKI